MSRRKYHPNVCFVYWYKKNGESAEELYRGSEEECEDYVHRETLPKGIITIEYYSIKFDEYKALHIYRVNR